MVCCWWNYYVAFKAYFFFHALFSIDMLENFLNFPTYFKCCLWDSNPHCPNFKFGDSCRWSKTAYSLIVQSNWNKVPTWSTTITKYGLFNSSFLHFTPDNSDKNAIFESFPQIPVSLPCFVKIDNGESISSRH